MTDYISRQAAIDAIQSIVEPFAMIEPGTTRVIGAAVKDADVITVLESLPTADVRENVHGDWDFEEYPDGYYHSECSICGSWFKEDVFLNPYNFCPNCGADMRGEP